MDKLAFLDELIVMIRTGEIHTVEPVQDAEQMLSDIKVTVAQNLHREVFDDITSPDTGFYAPEHVSWKAYLIHCNGYADYAAALDEYTEDELDGLWSISHIAEDLSDESLMREAFKALNNLKAIHLIELADPEAANDYCSVKEQFLAKLKGIYNLLCEG